MKQKLKAEYKDIPLLSAYIHDAYILISEVKYDDQNNVFSMAIERVCYEKGARSKVLGFIPLVRYPKVKSLLTIQNVNNMKFNWWDDAFDDDGYPHQVLDIISEDNTLTINSEMFQIKLDLTILPQIIMEDISEPSKKKITTDFSKSIFSGMDEINKLRV